MSDLPKFVTIQEEGPREGFQIESGPISTADKVRLIEALAETGLKKIDCVSWVNPARVPGMADAEEVARAIRRKPGVAYTGLWLNAAGFRRALKQPLDLIGSLIVPCSETFNLKNVGKTIEEAFEDQAATLHLYRDNKVDVRWATVFTAFGCNYEGEIALSTVVDRCTRLLDIAKDQGVKIQGLYLADTVGWANPNAIQQRVGALRERWPDMRIGLHLHDTRGTGLPNALAALQMGVDQFDSSCAGLGGCPFAAHKGAAGNICTEDFVFMCHEMGIETGIDLDRMIECALMAEEIVGHPLPGKVMKGGSLMRMRNKSTH
ncbi:MAG: hydroxymethylglutaryl-CoA lyase [Sulfuricaulis sp.]|nr:hydroxymethylglutaryl-CoA lyase [Sulfuricaulis sp.]